MATIFLANFGEENGGRLAAFLRAQRHETYMARDEHSFVEMKRRSGLSPDLVIMDASAHEDRVRRLANELGKYRIQHGPKPMILCISRVYRGPRFEIELERKGIRLLYV